MRSSESSSPMWIRIVGPPGSHCVAVRYLVICATWIRLSKPPQLEPMPKSFNALTNASIARSPIGISHEREKRSRAVEIALPDLMAGIVFQRGIDHTPHIRAFLKPARDGERALHLLLHPHADGAEAAQREVAVVGANAEAVIGDGFAHRQPVPLVGDDQSHHHVGMARDVLGRRVYGDVHAPLERAEVIRRTPSVVREHGYAARARHCRDRRNVLHLEGQRARRFAEHRLRVGAEQALDARADQWIVVFDLYAVGLQAPSQKVRVGTYTESVTSTWSPVLRNAQSAAVIAESPEGSATAA